MNGNAVTGARRGDQGRDRAEPASCGTSFAGQSGSPSRGSSAPLPIRDAPTRSPGQPFGLHHRKAARTVARGVSVVDKEAIAVGVFDGQAKAQSPTKSGWAGASVVVSVRYGGVPLAPTETTTLDPLLRPLRRPLYSWIHTPLAGASLGGMGSCCPHGGGRA